jgi:hypothetical protein
MNTSNKFNIKKWNESYDRGENNILYPQPEVVKFLNRFIRKINEISQINNFVHSRFHLVIELK